MDAIYKYISQDKPGAAAAAIEKLLKAIEQLGVHQNLGHEGRRPKTREFVQRPFVIVYRIKKGRAEVAAVIGGKRKYE